MRIILLGPSGCGKGTQANNLVEKFDLPHIETGKLLQEAVAGRTPDGLEAEKYMQVGKLVPNDLVFKILQARLEQDDCRRGFVLEGFPRSVSQLPFLDDFLARKGEELDHVVLLETSLEEALRRMRGRIGEMEAAGQEVREDDRSEAAIRERFGWYERNIDPITQHYEKQGLLRRVNNGQPMEEVFEEILEKITNS